MAEKEKPQVKIRVRNLTKRFELLATRSQKIRNLLSFKNKKNHYFWALRGVSFDVYDGEAVAVIGLNGSGKSTLSNIVSEVYPPTTGTLDINGDSSIIAIGAGLKDQLSGRDNIRLKLLMNGLKAKEVKQLMPAIIDFSELGEFIDQPVKSYSSGMKSKLGFAIMAHTDPDIMLIDEALSVGDATFASKSFAKIKEFKEHGKTIFFVSHSMSQLRRIADRVIWMHFGEIKMIGPVDDVLPRYEKWLADFNSLTDEQREYYNAKMKEEQAKFSLESFIDAQSQKQLKALPVAHTRLEKVEYDKQKAALEKKLQQQLSTDKQKLKQIQFGYLNWIVATALLMAAIFTGLTVFASDMTQYRQNRDLQRLQEQRGRVSSTSQSSSEASSSSESSEETSVIDSDGDGIPDDQDPTPNGEVPVVDSDGDGIPDAEDPTPNGEILPPVQSVVDSDGDGIPDNQDPTPYGDPTPPPATVPEVPTAPEVPSSSEESTVEESISEGTEEPTP